MVVIYYVCGVGGDGDYVDGDDGANYVVDGDCVCGNDGGNNDNGKNDVEVGKDGHVILVDTHGDYQPW